MSILHPNGQVISPNSGPCPTVRVVSPESPGGFKVINESDLTHEHEVWTGEEASAHKPIMSMDEIVRDELVTDTAPKTEGEKPASQAKAERPVLSLNSQPAKKNG